MDLSLTVMPTEAHLRGVEATEKTLKEVFATPTGRKVAAILIVKIV